MYRVSTAGASGRNLYVSATTGEVLQETHARERFWNWPGAVTHWIYPTFLRRDWDLWDNVVWWISLFGVCVALTGGLLGFFQVPRRSAAKQNLSRECLIGSRRFAAGGAGTTCSGCLQARSC